jgi:hypothetical protein
LNHVAGGDDESLSLRYPGCMRAFMLLIGVAVAACAVQHSSPQANKVVAPAPAGAAAGPADIETQRLAAAKNMNLEVFNKDGQQLFCRSNLITGSHIQRDTRCYTAAQLDIMDRAVQREVDEFLVKPNIQNPASIK